jgi:hypothetical protein
MARNSQIPPEIERLIRLSEASRACLSHDAAAFRQRLDVPARVRQALCEHPAKWLGGSLAAGLAAVLFIRRRKAAPPKKHRGVRGLLFSLAIAAVRPIIKTWLTDLCKQFIISQIRSHPLSRSLSNNCGGARLP